MASWCTNYPEAPETIGDDNLLCEFNKESWKPEDSVKKLGHGWSKRSDFPWAQKRKDLESQSWASANDLDEMIPPSRVTQGENWPDMTATRHYGKAEGMGAVLNMHADGKEMRLGTAGGGTGANMHLDQDEENQYLWNREQRPLDSIDACCMMHDACHGPVGSRAGGSSDYKRLNCACNIANTFCGDEAVKQMLVDDDKSLTITAAAIVATFEWMTFNDDMSDCGPDGNWLLQMVWAEKNYAVVKRHPNGESIVLEEAKRADPRYIRCLMDQAFNDDMTPVLDLTTVSNITDLKSLEKVTEFKKKIISNCADLLEDRQLAVAVQLIPGPFSFQDCAEAMKNHPHAEIPQGIGSNREDDFRYMAKNTVLMLCRFLVDHNDAAIEAAISTLNTVFGETTRRQLQKQQVMGLMQMPIDTFTYQESAVDEEAVELLSNHLTQLQNGIHEM